MFDKKFEEDIKKLLYDLPQVLSQHDTVNDAFPSIRDNLLEASKTLIESDSSDIAPIFEDFYIGMKDSKVIHEAFVSNVALVLLIKHFEHLTGRNLSALIEAVDKYVKPKENQITPDRNKLIMGLLACNLIHHGANKKNTYEVVSTIFRCSESEVKKVCKDYIFDKSVDKQDDELIFILFASILGGTKDWRASDDVLKGYNHNRRNALLNTYRAYDKFKVSLATKYLKEIKEILIAYDSDEIKQIILTKEKSLELSNIKDSYEDDEILGMCMLYMPSKKQNILFDLSKLLEITL